MLGRAACNSSNSLSVNVEGGEPSWLFMLGRTEDNMSAILCFSSTFLAGSKPVKSSSLGFAMVKIEVPVGRKFGRKLVDGNLEEGIDKVTGDALVGELTRLGVRLLKEGA
jgi:hypothetical protein